MTNIKHISYEDMPCIRCGSKRFVSKKWKEKIATYLGGFAEVEYTQIDCTNKECQEKFELEQVEEAEKKELLKIKKIADTKERAEAPKSVKKKVATKRSRI